MIRAKKPKHKTITIAIPPPLESGACDAGCPLFAIAWLAVNGAHAERCVRWCCRGWAGIIDRDGPLFPGPGCPQYREDGR